jgi:mannosylglycerate hydrolase
MRLKKRKYPFHLMTLPEFATSPPIYAYLHTHWDREWYGSFRTYQLRLTQVLDEILDRLEQADLPCFTLDGQTVLLEDYLALRPQNKNRLLQLVQSGKLHVGPWFVMPDEFLVSGESLIRNLKRGIEEARTWGSKTFTGYLPDTFGHSGDVPTILKLFGIESAIVWRGVPPEKLNQPVFHWTSPSGETVQTLWLEKGYFQNVLTDLEHPLTNDNESRLKALKTLVQDLSRSTLPPILPIGGDHLGAITKAQIDWLRQQEGIGDRLEILHPHQYFEKITINPDSICFSKLEGELTDCEAAFLLPGVYSSRMYLKQANRILEHRLTKQLEPWLALRSANGQSLSTKVFEQELDLAWKLLLLNHPHDSICGCSIDAVHRENEVRFQEVTDILNSIESRLWASGFEALTEPQWKLLNLSQETFTGVVPLFWQSPLGLSKQEEEKSELQLVSQGIQIQEKKTLLANQYLADVQDIPMAHLTQTQYTGWGWVQDLPPHSEHWLSNETALDWSLPSSVHPVEAELTKDGQRATLGNGLFEVTFQVGQAGCQISEIANTTQYPQMFELWDFEDQGDSYNSGPVRGTTPKQAMISKLTLLDAGPLLATVEVDYQLTGMALSAKFQIRANDMALDIALTLDNHRPNHKLQWLCETGKAIQIVQAESHLSVTTRHYDPDYHESHVPPPEPFQELKTNTGPIQRFIQTNGQAFITEGLCEYEVRGSQLGLTLLRAFGALSSANTGVRGAQAGPPFATPEGQCLNRKMTLRCQWRPGTQAVENLYQWADHFYGVVSGKLILPKRKHLGEESPSDSNLNTDSAPFPLIHWHEKRLRTSAMTWLQSKPNDSNISKFGLVLRLVNVSSEKVFAHFQGTLQYEHLQYHHLEELNGLDEPMDVIESSIVPFNPYEVKTILFCVE